MFSTARKLGVICCILAAFNIVGLVMLTMLFAGAGLSFTWIFSLLLYLITITTIGLLLTFGIRSMSQDSEMEVEATSIQIKKLKDRVEELEKKLK